MELRVGGKYRVGKQIDCTHYSDHYEATNINTGEAVDVFLQSVTTRGPNLAYEYKVLRILDGDVGTQQARWFGREGNFNVMVANRLGPNLEDLFDHCSRQFTLKTVLMLADQMLARIEYIHTKNFIHRHLQPEYFHIGLGGENLNQVYITSFGEGRRYRDPRAHRHIPYVEGKPFIGNPKFASINAHLGIELSRRDDLESLGYIFMYFNKGGQLPWEGVTV